MGTRVCVRTQIKGRPSSVFVEGNVVDVNLSTKQFTVQLGAADTQTQIVSIFKIKYNSFYLLYLFLLPYTVENC